MSTASANDKTETKWLRTESRIVRPFRYSEDLLDKVSVRIYPEDEFTNSNSIQKDEIDIEKVAPEFRLDFDPTVLKDKLGFELEQLRLIVSLEDRALKRTMIAINLPMESCPGESKIIERPICNMFSWVGETKIQVAIVLSNDRKANIGEANRAGHWLAKKEISISRFRDAANFPTEIIPPAGFVRFGLPKETAYYVGIFGEDFNQPCETLPDLVTIYINEKVGQVLSKAEDSPAGRVLLRMILSDSAATILSCGLMKLDSEKQLVKYGILHVVLSKLSDATGKSIKDIIKLAKEPGGSKLRTLMQTETNLTKAIASLSFRG